VWWCFSGGGGVYCGGTSVVVYSVAVLLWLCIVW